VIMQILDFGWVEESVRAAGVSGHEHPDILYVTSDFRIHRVAIK